MIQYYKSMNLQIVPQASHYRQLRTQPLPIDPVQIKNEALALPDLVVAGHMYLNQGSLIEPTIYWGKKFP